MKRLPRKEKKRAKKFLMQLFIKGPMKAWVVEAGLFRFTGSKKSKMPASPTRFEWPLEIPMGAWFQP